MKYSMDDRPRAPHRRSEAAHCSLPSTRRPLATTNSIRRRVATVGPPLFIAAIVLLALAGPAAAQTDRVPPSPAAVKVPAERMVRAGLTRPADLFGLLGGWTTASRDGYVVRTSAAGMPGAPLLTVGNTPFSGGLFGQPPLPMLPVHLAQVRTATASVAPRLVAGRLAPNGAVRLRLRQPARGFSARGAASAGNEVGDPGPFRTLNQAPNNVDRLGPQYFVETGLGTDRARLQLSLRTLRHYTTDALIRPRVDHLRIGGPGDPPRQHLIASRLALQAQDPNLGRHRLSAHYARLRALPYFETLGAEVPARRYHAQVGVAGHAPPLSSDSTRRLRYRLSYTRAALASDADRLRTDAPLPLAFDGVENHIGGLVALGAVPLRLARRPLRMRFGLSADYTRALSHPALDDPTLLTTRGYAQLSADSSVRVQPRLTALVSQTDGHFGGGLLLSALGPQEARWSFGVHLTYMRRPYAAGGPFWYWLQQGLRVPRLQTGHVSLPAAFPPSHRLTTDVRLRRAFHRSHVALELGVRHFRDLTLPRSDIGYDSLSNGLVPDLQLRPDASGQTFRMALTGMYSFPAALTHRLRYDLFAYHAAGGGASREAFAQRFARVPRHQLRYTARLSVGERFSLEGRLTARAPTRWPAYTRAARAEGSPYRRRLPAYALLDVTAMKRLWHDHLRLRLALRNLLDAPFRSHPAGPLRRLNLFVSLAAKL